MSLQDDKTAKRPGEWTDDDIRSLQNKHRRTHFTHFSPLPRKLKSAPRKKVRGVWYVKLFGQWTPEKPKRNANAGETPEVQDGNLI